MVAHYQQYSSWLLWKASSVILQFIDGPTFLLTILLTYSLVLCFHVIRKKMSPPIYLVDYVCARCPDDYKINMESMFFFLKKLGTISDRDIMFQSRVFLKSGIGEEAYVPRVTLEKARCVSLDESREQIHILIVNTIDTLLKKSGLSPKLIDIVVINCTGFNPTPSLTAVVVNAFKMRADVKTFHLSGMGCSAGLISLGLAGDLLRANKEARYALVASSEVMNTLYDGKERPMMVTNCLFRCAGNAVLLSNRKEDKRVAKMEVMRVLRVNTAWLDEAHNVVETCEDGDGIWGARLSPQLVKVASDTLAMNIERLAPKVLPMGELCKAGWNFLQRRVFKKKGVESYMPNFKLAFEHFCIHPGGRAVIEGVGKGLHLQPYDVEPSAMALHRFGNTSCSGIWYVLSYMEAKQRLKKGDRVWQIGLGSGFKCNSAVLRVLRDLHCEYENCWQDCVHRYPVKQELTRFPHIAWLFDFGDKIVPGIKDGKAAPLATTTVLAA
ncbi:hypothetical protein GOP47_0009071 [Adiantum capillus-veneris]|uniref:3-ketoacyl-CoA synthase n=1 Tax=Adiantum capillus-veneris TaxID=13818 RepID=A0A9D4ZKY3_ADICA|nr:hypothetical protein GOP47_0009071 [Adiantum capillus-veneris]